jgi:hypothetical protein
MTCTPASAGFCIICVLNPAMARTFRAGRIAKRVGQGGVADSRTARGKIVPVKFAQVRIVPVPHTAGYFKTPHRMEVFSLSDLGMILAQYRQE